MEDKKQTLSRCFRALRDRGRLLIVEGLLPNDATIRAEHAVIRGMQLDFALHGHSFMTLRELKKLVRSAGFGSVKVSDLGGRLFMVTAEK